MARMAFVLQSLPLPESQYGLGRIWTPNLCIDWKLPRPANKYVCVCMYNVYIYIYTFICIYAICIHTDVYSVYVHNDGLLFVSFAVHGFWHVCFMCTS